MAGGRAEGRAGSSGLGKPSRIMESPPALPGQRQPSSASTSPTRLLNRPRQGWGRTAALGSLGRGNLSSCPA